MRRPQRAVLLAIALAAASGLAQEREYVVQRGETLWHIADRVAGDPYLWPLLYRANRDQIKDPSVLYPGQVLTIPDLDGADAQTLRAAPPAAPDPDRH